MEGEGGRFRRNHCVPMPVIDSIDELTRYWPLLMRPMTTAGSPTVPTLLARIGRWRRRCCAPCQVSCSTRR